MILAFSDVAWNGLFGMLATVIVAWIVNRAAKKQEVKIDKVELKVEKVAEVAEKTLTHVNSRMGLQLKLGAISARRLAKLNPKNEADQEAANLAEKLLTEHEKEQVVVDEAAQEREDAAQPSIGNVSPM